MNSDERLQPAHAQLRSGRYLPPAVVAESERWLLVLPDVTTDGLERVADTVATAQAANLMFRPIFLVPSDARTSCLAEHAFQYETLIARHLVLDVTGLTPDQYLQIRVVEMCALYEPTVRHILTGPQPPPPWPR